MKIISPLIDPKINLTKKGFFYSGSSHNYKTLPVEDTEESVDFTAEQTKSSHTFLIDQICEETLSSAITMDIGISERSHEQVETKTVLKRHKLGIKY